MKNTKYIRTKNGIYNKRKLAFAFREDYYPTDEDYEKLLQTQIIKQADTIEELCDEFIVYAPNEERIKRYRSSEYPEKLKEIYKAIKEDNKEVYFYGAIWTDKGLIYVAKMNEKGELELL